MKQGRVMLEFLFSVLAALRVFLRSRSDTALEVLALRQQVAVLKRQRPRPTLTRLDRFFWTCASRISNSLAESRVGATLRGTRYLTYAVSRMKDILLALLHLAVMTAKLSGPGGVRTVIAENLILKQQLIVLRRARHRAPNLALSDRLVCGLGSLFLSPGRIRKVAIAVRPSTLLAFHQALVGRKYHRLFSSSHCPKKPGPKGPSAALIQAIVELKSRNPRFGCPRIARIISLTFGVDIDKNVVYRVLSKHDRPATGGTGPSWLSFIGHTTDSLWSVG
jgi:hypothetical protein